MKSARVLSAFAVTILACTLMLSYREQSYSQSPSWQPPQGFCADGRADPAHPCWRNWPPGVLQKLEEEMAQQRAYRLQLKRKIEARPPH